MSNLKRHCLKKETICFTAKVLQATTGPPVHNSFRIHRHQAQQQLIYIQGTDRFSCLDSIVPAKEVSALQRLLTATSPASGSLHLAVC